MFTERELLILSYAVDVYRSLKKDGDTFFTHAEADALCGKIHNVLRATRGLPGEPADWQRDAANMFKAS